MKKLLALFLSVAIVLTLVGCGDNHTPSTDPTDAPTIPTTDPSGNATDGTTEPPHIHEHQISDTIGATCTEGGYTVYVCDCGDIYNEPTTEALGHRYGEWVTVKESTEAEEGQAQRSCAVCDEVETRALAKLIADHTHSYTEKVTKEATCSAEGIKTFTCSCGDTYTENIARAAHDYSDTVTAATCTAGGYTTHTCNLCGYSYVDGKTDSTSHKWGEWVTTKEPTTTSAGTAERTCSNCAKKETKTLDKLVEGHTHSYTETVTKSATCTEDGVKTFSCSCGSSYTETVTKLGHSYTSQVTEPTCTAGGYTIHICSLCGNSYKDSATSALGHQWDSGTVTTQPTCTKSGVKTYTCKRSGCGQTKTEAIAKTGHNYKSTVTKPTCTEQGYTTHTCSGCGDSYTDSKVAATGHVNTTTKTVEPTCTEDGYTMTTCDDCGAPISTTTIESTGECSFTIKMNLATAVKAEYDRGYTDYIEYIQSEDFDVMVCSCGTIDISSKTFRYTDNQAANIMLNYVNELRAANGMFALEIDSSLMSLARTMVEETMLYGYPTTSTTAWCWHADGGYNIYHHFTAAKSSFQDEMLNWNYEYFAYVADTPSKRYTSALYGVILMK